MKNSDNNNDSTPKNNNNNASSSAASSLSVLLPSWFERTSVRILQCGPIPKHIAFIMDGNRRFAQKNHQETVYGHKAGFSALKEVLS